MRPNFCISVRRVTSVGCAVNTSSTRSRATASYSRSGSTPDAISRPNVSSHDPICGGASASR